MEVSQPDFENRIRKVIGPIPLYDKVYLAQPIEKVASDSGRTLQAAGDLSKRERAFALSQYLQEQTKEGLASRLARRTRR